MTGNYCLPVYPGLNPTQYLATGCAFSEFCHNFQLGMTTTRSIAGDLCAAILTTMKDKWQDIRAKGTIPKLYRRRRRVIQPPQCGSLFYNYKGYFSNALLYVDIGTYGKCSDFIVCKDSTLFQKLSNKTLQISDNRPRKEKLFNYWLSRAGRYIECTFVSLANKWLIFHCPLGIIAACCALKNFVHLRDGVMFEDMITHFSTEEKNAGMQNRNRCWIGVHPRTKLSWHNIL
ncbi:hypothetical protein PR048_007134 [Dryococelus australis]|uniref:Uncharacterized protein n=1 Tax=Dryococelus australis TaxID=614101 RepID=A0ABQ9ICS4_9NEOP|nr:hypothetical protein PR048_007134 [Dryococelus australis]